MAALWLSEGASDRVDTSMLARQEEVVEGVVADVHVFGMTEPEAESKTVCWHSMTALQLCGMIVLKK